MSLDEVAKAEMKIKKPYVHKGFFGPNGETYTWAVEGALAHGPHKVFAFFV